MMNWKKCTLCFILTLYLVLNVPVSPSSIALAKSKEPVSLSELTDGELLFKPLSKFVTEKLDLTTDDASYLTINRFFEVSLGGLPKGYSRQFLAFAYNTEGIELVLMASNADESKIILLDRLLSSDQGNLFINTAKLNITTENNRIVVWSQTPFRAFQSEVVLEWTGVKLKIISHIYSDPSQEYYDKKERLLRNKDIQGLIKLYESDDPFYPGAYAGTYTLGPPTLLLSHQKALLTYKKNVKTAISYLNYGFAQYTDGYGPSGYIDGTVTKADFVAADYDSYPEGRLSLAVYVDILNNYGYFLSLDGRNKDAKLILTNVIKLVPDRTVAYLNLADVEWTLDQRTVAKGHYKQYVKLLGNKAASIAPKRVQERINVK
jgi:tetratricopeptide (TPR) repeat protein